MARLCQPFFDTSDSTVPESSSDSEVRRCSRAETGKRLSHNPCTAAYAPATIDRLCTTRNRETTNAASVSVALPDGFAPLTWKSLNAAA